MDLKELKELIRLVSEKGITEFEMEREGIRLRICRSAATDSVTYAPLPAPLPTLLPLPAAASPESAVAPYVAVTPVPPPPPAVAPAPPAAEEVLHIIKSPIVGTFYRSPSPTADPFVKIGDHIERDTVVCIIEAMKLMNEIQSETVGEVAKVFVENGQPVEFGQPLFGIKG